MNTKLLNKEKLTAQIHSSSINQEIARIQVRMIQLRQEKNFEQVLHLENRIETLQGIINYEK